MNVAVGGVREQVDRPAHVRFEIRVIEDKAASLKEGRFVGRDVEYAITTIPYSKDESERDVENWKEKMDGDVRSGRYPEEWRDRNLRQYEAWKKGQELPLDGTPIKGWSVISPATQANLIAMKVFTVEDLAAINDEGMRRLPMLGLELKTKAKAWLAQSKDKGPLTMQMAALQTQLENMQVELKTVKEQNEQLRAMVPQPKIVGSDTASEAQKDPLDLD